MSLKCEDEMSKVASKGIELAKNEGFDVSEDNFTIIQPFNNGECIMLAVNDDDGVRKMKYEVNDSIMILPKIDGNLDVFN